MSRLTLYDSGSSSAWARQVDWTNLPSVTSAEQKFAGLFAVFDTTSSFVALTATGNFTVDWGDGSATEDIASGVTAQHQYTYASVSGTVCSRGYKMVIITIVPQSGQNLDSVDINKRHSGASAQVQRVPWLDIICSCRAASTTGFSCGPGTNVSISALEQATILNGGSRTDFSNMFLGCNSLQSVPLFNTAAGTNFANMFSNCTSLQNIPVLNTAAGTNFSGMFNACSSLREAPVLNTASGTNFSSMFGNCTSLQNAPALNTAAGTNFSSMFVSCTSLRTVPVLNTASGTDFSSMFSSCRSLLSPPALNTAAGTNFSSMFNTAISLQSVPALNTAAGTNLGSMFNSCASLGRSLITGAAMDHAYTNCNLSATALDEIYTALPVVVGKTITVTGNYGVSGDTPLIATAKGWAVVG